MNKLVAAFLGTVIVAASTPVAAQSLSVLASAERLVSAAALEQDVTTVRRSRSMAVAGLGIGLLTAGVSLATIQPKCVITTDGPDGDFLGATYTYRPIRKAGECDVQIDWVSAGVGPTDRFGRGRTYISDVRDLDNSYVWSSEVEDVRFEERKFLRYTGIALAGAGGVLLWYGLARVDVPIRLDVMPGGGFRASRSFGW